MKMSINTLLIGCLVICSKVCEIYTLTKSENSTKIFDWLFSVIGISTTTIKPIFKECLPCECGMQKLIRIVDGTETEVNQYPWMAYIAYKGSFLCGASLISDRYLISSAHGVSVSRLGNLRAVFHDHDISVQNETDAITRKISRIIINKKFNVDIKYNNDIALLKLDKDIFFNSKIMPICLPQNDDNTFESNIGTVIGWGSNVEFGEFSNTLQHLEVPIWSNEECKNTGYGGNITANMLCAGYKEGGKDACKGDSGGPLQININGTSTLVGIVSWGYGCGVENFPGVYTRVSTYLQWIANNTADGCFCNSNIL